MTDNPSPDTKPVAVQAGDALSLASRIKGIQHVGLTVQNMDRAFEFYTEVLGGKELMRQSDIHGAEIHNLLLTMDEIAAHEGQVDCDVAGVPDLRGGAQRLDLRLILFDTMVLELLQYRDADQPMGSGKSWAEPQAFSSPALPRSMHICFHVHADVDFSQFIHDLEAEATRRGMTEVKANRIVTVTSEQERLLAPRETNAMRITEGLAAGWSFIYCKGPEGEQLEFVQTT